SKVVRIRSAILRFLSFLQRVHVRFLQRSEICAACVRPNDLEGQRRRAGPSAAGGGEAASRTSIATRGTSASEPSNCRNRTAIDHILASRDRCGAIGGEEGDQFGHLGRPRRTAKRNAAE